VSCDAFSDDFTELVRGTLPPARRSEALAHVESCAACAAELMAERTLSLELCQLASADVEREAPPALETRLLRTFRASVRRSARPRRSVPAWAWPLAAAAAALALWGALPRRAPRQEGQPVEEAAYRPLWYGGIEDVDGYQVVRVRLSRSALTGLGFAVTDNEARAVAADVIVGQDGVARGIRLLR
jgi:Putative zinc-finger